MKIEQFASWKPFVKTKMFGQESNFRARGNISQCRVQHASVTARGRDQSEQHFYRSGFARAVRSQKAKNLTPLYIQSEVGNSNFRAEFFAKRARFTIPLLPLRQVGP